MNESNPQSPVDPTEQFRQIAQQLIINAFNESLSDSTQTAKNQLVASSKRRIQTLGNDGGIDKDEIASYKNALMDVMLHGQEIQNVIETSAARIEQIVSKSGDSPPLLEDYTIGVLFDLFQIVDSKNVLDDIVSEAMRSGWNKGNETRLANGGGALDEEDDIILQRINDERLKREEMEKAREENEKRLEQEQHNNQQASIMRHLEYEAAEIEEFETLIKANGIEVDRLDDGTIAMSKSSMRLLTTLMRDKGFPSDPIPEGVVNEFDTYDDAVKAANERGVAIIRNDLRHDSLIDALEHGGYMVWFDEFMDVYCIKNPFAMSLTPLGTIRKPVDDCQPLISAAALALQYSVHIKEVKVPDPEGGKPRLKWAHVPLKRDPWGAGESVYSRLVQNKRSRVIVVNPVHDYIEGIVREVEGWSEDQRIEYEESLRGLFTYIPSIEPNPAIPKNREIAEWAGLGFGTMMGIRMMQQYNRDEDHPYKSIQVNIRPQRETPILIGPPNIGKSTIAHKLLPVMGNKESSLGNGYFATIDVSDGGFNKWVTYLDKSLLVLLDEFNGAGPRARELNNLLTSRNVTFDRKFREPEAKLMECVFIGASNNYKMPNDPGLSSRLTFIHLINTRPDQRNDIRMKEAIRYLEDNIDGFVKGMISRAMRTCTEDLSIEMPDHLQPYRLTNQAEANENMTSLNDTCKGLIEIAGDAGNPLLKSKQGRPFIPEAVVFLAMGWLEYQENVLSLNHAKGDQIQMSHSGVEEAIKDASLGVGFHVIQGAFQKAVNNKNGKDNRNDVVTAMRQLGWIRQREGSEKMIRKSIKGFNSELNGYIPG